MSIARAPSHTISSTMDLLRRFPPGICNFYLLLSHVVQPIPFRLQWICFTDFLLVSLISSFYNRTWSSSYHFVYNGFASQISSWYLKFLVACIDKWVKSKFEDATPPELCSGPKLAIWYKNQPPANISINISIKISISISSVVLARCSAIR